MSNAGVNGKGSRPRPYNGDKYRENLAYILANKKRKFPSPSSERVNTLHK